MIMRTASFLCTVRGIARLVRICARCHSTLRRRIETSHRMTTNRISCDACTRPINRTTKKESA
jgi:hypothetical protein